MKNVYKEAKILNADIIKRFYLLADECVGNFSYKELVDFFKECLINAALERTNFKNIPASKLLRMSKSPMYY